MSPHLHYEIVRASQSEIAARTVHAHHANDLRATAHRSRRPLSSRVGKTVAAVGVCLAATGVVTVNGAFASQKTARTERHISAAQLSQNMHVLESEGYLPYQCTRKGTMMRNSRTGRLELVSW
jgi:hypothetical protein